jgi:hypothetical protein
MHVGRGTDASDSELQLPAQYGQNDCVMVVGRKGWMFSDTVKGAVASANLFSIVETAKANGVEPHAYLSLLFAQLPYAKTVEDFERLLPWNVKSALVPTASHQAAPHKNAVT